MFFKTYQRWFFLAIACFCGILIAVAVFLQVTRNMLPCPICILQRYAFILIGCFACLYAFYKKRLYLYGALASAIGGVCLCIVQWHAIANPVVQCGKDWLEVIVNSIFLANWCPILFKAMSFCNEDVGKFLGLMPVHWALFWFVVFCFIFSGQLKRTK